MNKIEVTIPAQSYEAWKYSQQPCYLEQALMDAGFNDVSVGAVGRTRIGNERYIARINGATFCARTLKEAIETGEPVTVTLT